MSAHTRTPPLYTGPFSEVLRALKRQLSGELPSTFVYKGGKQKG